MKFKVLWTHDASQDLAELWASSRLKIAITAAANSLDQVLARSPHEIGESRKGIQRIAFRSPLGIDFEIREDPKTVYVTRVWQY